MVNTLRLLVAALAPPTVVCLVLRYNRAVKRSQAGLRPPPSTLLAIALTIAVIGAFAFSVSTAISFLPLAK